MLKGLNSLFYEPLFVNSAVGASLYSNPLGFIDIGARGGVHPLVEPLAGATAVLAFEPDEVECNRLQAQATINSPFASIVFKPVALSETAGAATLYRFVNPVTDSLLPENPYVAERYGINSLVRICTNIIKTSTLDDVLFGGHGVPNNFGELLKLDVQGLEYDLLHGAIRTLEERTVAVYCETCFLPVYQGQKLFSEVELFFREHGFFFYGFQSMHYRSSKSKNLNKMTETGRERLMWADALFFKDPILIGLRQNQLSERGNLALFTCALLTGYYDFAIELALETWAQGDEAVLIKKLVHQIAYLDASESYQEVLALAERMKSNPERANFEVGRFVDNRRYYNNYDDILPYRS